MAVSQKTRVVLQYLVPIAMAYFVLGTFLLTKSIPATTELLSYVGGMAGLILATTLAQDIVPKSFKETIVFWRLANRLPGHRAFTSVFDRRERYDLTKISNLDELRSLTPEDQHRIFYNIYRKNTKDIRVEHYSFRYLAWRDSASSLLILALVTVPALKIFSSRDWSQPAWELATATLFGYFCATAAARQASNELVMQVLTAETLGKRHVVK